MKCFGANVPFSMTSHVDLQMTLQLLNDGNDHTYLQSYQFLEGFDLLRAVITIIAKHS